MGNDTSLTATTPSGKSVLLKGDGTWVFQAPPVRAPESASGFRKTTWGMDRADVIASEDKEDYEEGENFIAFSGNIAGLPCTIIYVFVRDSLVRGKLAFTVEHANKNVFLTDFETLKGMLTKKYGSPDGDETIWNADTYEDDPSEWGMAVSCGDLVKLASWDLGETQISAMLSGDNFQIELSIHYKSTALGYLEDQLNEQRALDEL
jgi:hypothetical protein